MWWEARVGEGGGVIEESEARRPPGAVLEWPLQGQQGQRAIIELLTSQCANQIIACDCGPRRVNMKWGVGECSIPQAAGAATSINL